MKRYKQNPDFLHLGERLLQWYKINARELDWRFSKSPYNIWISEIILQQTQVEQGLPYYQRFIERFSNVEALAEASMDEVLLYWKGLGYYSRALNLHKAAQQIVNDFGGQFPSSSEGLEALRGVGKYTAAAIASICYGEAVPAVDGNFYRVLSRLFADDFDISSSKSFNYFSNLAYRIMPPHAAGDFNQAIMDLGATVCTPKKALCEECPFMQDCLSFQAGKVYDYPVKTKKTKVSDEILHYYYIEKDGSFLIKKRGTEGIWKNLFDLPQLLNEKEEYNIIYRKEIKHKLSHRNLTLVIDVVDIRDERMFKDLVSINNALVMTKEELSKYSFPKPIDSFLHQYLNANVEAEQGRFIF